MIDGTAAKARNDQANNPAVRTPPASPAHGRRRRSKFIGNNAALECNSGLSTEERHRHCHSGAVVGGIKGSKRVTGRIDHHARLTSDV